ncbi:hypothetical protein MRX96_052707 [Rhipicephalus microplus]
MCACSHHSFSIPGPCTPRPILLFQAFNLSSAFITGTGYGLEWDCFYGAWHGAAVTSTASAVAAVTRRCSSSLSDVRVLPPQFPDSWAVYAATDPAFQAFNLSSAFLTGTGYGLEWDCFYGAWHGAAVTSTASAVAAVTSRCSSSLSDVCVLSSQFPDSWAVYAATDPAFRAFNLSSAFITGTGYGLEWDCFYGAWHGAAVTSTASAVAAVTSRCCSSSSDVCVLSSQFPDSWAVYAATDPAFQAFNLSAAFITGTGYGLEWDCFYGAWHRAAVMSTASAVAAVTSRWSSSSSDVRVLPPQFPDSLAVYAATDPAFQAFNLSSAFITGTGYGLEWDCFYGAWHGAAVTSTALAVAAVTSRCSSSSSDVCVLSSQFPDSWAVYAATDPAFQAFNLSSAFITGTGYGLEWDCFYGAWHGAAVTSTASAVAAVTSRCSSSSSDVCVLSSQFPRFLGRVRRDRSCFLSFQFIIGVYHGHRLRT